MALDVDVVIDQGIAPRPDEALVECLSWAAEHEPGAPRGNWAMTLRLTSDATISAIHGEFFGDDRPTDVISFPSGDDLSASAGYLGDVVIAAETASEQAAEAGHSTAREIAFLALHGFLHLCGYDDRDDAERRAMLQRQTELLEGFERANGPRW